MSNSPNVLLDISAVIDFEKLDRRVERLVHGLEQEPQELTSPKQYLHSYVVVAGPRQRRRAVPLAER